MDKGTQPKQASAMAANPVATAFGLLVLAALAYLVLTRLLFGRIAIEAGTR